MAKANLLDISVVLAVFALSAVAVHQGGDGEEHLLGRLGSPEQGADFTDHVAAGLGGEGHGREPDVGVSLAQLASLDQVAHQTSGGSGRHRGDGIMEEFPGGENGGKLDIYDEGFKCKHMVEK